MFFFCLYHLFLIAAGLDHRVNCSECLRRRARALHLWRLLPEVRPAIGDDLKLVLVIGRKHHLRLHTGLESLAPLLAQLDVCSGGRRRVLILVLVKVARTNLRKRRVELVEAQSLGEVLLIEALRASVSTSEERVDPRPFILHDIVQVVRGATDARVLDARIRPQKEDTLLLCLPRVGRPACWPGSYCGLCSLVRQEPEVLLVRATEVRIHGTADSLGDAWAPVREQALALLVGERGLRADLGVERGGGRGGGHCCLRKIFMSFKGYPFSPQRLHQFFCLSGISGISVISGTAKKIKERGFFLFFIFKEGVKRSQALLGLPQYGQMILLGTLRWPKTGSTSQPLSQLLETPGVFTYASQT